MGVMERSPFTRDLKSLVLHFEIERGLFISTAFSGLWKWLPNPLILLRYGSGRRAHSTHESSYQPRPDKFGKPRGVFDERARDSSGRHDGILQLSYVFTAAPRRSQGALSGYHQGKLYFRLDAEYSAF